MTCRLMKNFQEVTEIPLSFLSFAVTGKIIEVESVHLVKRAGSKRKVAKIAIFDATYLIADDI